MITISFYKMKHKVRLPARKYLTKFVEASLTACQKGCDYTLALTFVDDAEMALLNERWLQRKGPTDVLRFTGEDGDLGEVIISLDMLRRVSIERHASVQSIVTRYIAHGVLSLLGFDHKEGEHADKNQALEDTIVKGIV